MKNINTYILEKSINAKNRDVKYIKGMFLHGKLYNNIKCFGIITAQNPNSGNDYEGKSKTEINGLNKKSYEDFKKRLKNAHYKFIPADGKFGNNENSVVIININLNELKKYAAMYDQTSFWFCYPKDNSLQCEYWEKNDITKPLGKDNQYKLIETSDRWEEIPDADNYYTAIGKKFKFSIDLKYFNEVNELIETNFNMLCEKRNSTLDINRLISFTINGTGFVPYNYRKILNN